MKSPWGFSGLEACDIRKLQADVVFHSPASTFSEKRVKGLEARRITAENCLPADLS